MKRIAITMVVLLAAGAFIVLATGVAGGGSSQPKYWVEMDNAFGLVTGGDLKIAGVRAGKVTDIQLDRKTNRALVGFTITQNGFGSLRSDVFCQSRPQSLIGEYYLECEPGSSSQPLHKTSTTNPIPVTQTASVIAPDLVQDIFREPYRQRLSIILGELGAGVGGNGQNLSDTIHRAVPALRETDQVLSILAQQNRILADLAVQADTVVSDLAGNRADVQRFITSTRGAAADTAAQKTALEQGFAKLPGFLEQLQPAMAALGNTAVQNTPALQNLNASAGQLRRLFQNLGPFATASTPAFKALGQASVTGDQAARVATPTVQQLNAFAQGTPELSQNLAIILQHLDDPTYGADHDPRAVAQHPTTHSNTYTGLESLLQYVFDQSGDTIYFDQNSHLLGLSTFIDPTTCSPYADAKAAQNPANAKCRAWLGPTQPGVTTPDPTKKVATASAATRTARRRGKQVAAPTPAAQPQAHAQPTPTTTTPATPTPATKPGNVCILGVCLLPSTGQPAPANAPSVPQQAVNGVGSLIGGAASGQSQSGQSGQSGGQSNQNQRGNGLLNYLLGP